MSDRGRRRKDGTEFFERAGVWYARYRDHSGVRRRRSTGCTSRGDAEIEHATWALQERKRDAEPASRVRLASVLLNYADHAKDLRSARDAGRAIQYIAEHYGGCFVSDLTREAQDGFIRRLRERGCSAGYTRRIVAVLAAAVHLARKDHLIMDHPLIRRPPAGKSRQRWLTPQEAIRLQREAGEASRRLGRFVALALHTGARSEAIYHLTWDRVDLDKRLIDYTGPGYIETTKRRVVARMTPMLHTILDSMPTSERTGFVVGVASIKKSFRTACTRAGLGRDVTPNTLRHTFASWAVQAGVPLMHVARALGHSSTQMVERHYGHLAPDHLGDVADAVAGVMR